MLRASRGMVGWVGLFALLVASGCATTEEDRRKQTIWRYPHARTETFGRSPEDHEEVAWQVREHDRRSLAEDLDLFFMTDRTSRLTKWHDR